MKLSQIIGIIGSIIYLILFLLCLRRITITYKNYNNNNNNNNNNKLHSKFIFHVIILLFSIFELIFSITLIYYSNYSLGGYACHVFGMFLFTVSYSIVLHIWGQTIGRKYQFSKKAGTIVIGINFITVSITLGFIFSKQNFNEYVDQYEELNFMLTFVFCLSNILFTFGMLWFGLELQNRVKNSIVTNFDDHERKKEIIFRINLVLVICAICFSLRFIALGILSSNYFISDNNDDNSTHLGLLGWFILSNWIPNLIPAITLLFIMRVPSQPQSETQTETQSQIQTQSQSNLPYQPPTPSDEKNKLIQSPSQPNRFSNSSRFSGSGRLSSPNYPILPIQLDIMDLNGIEGLLVEYRGSTTSAP